MVGYADSSAGAEVSLDELPPQAATTSDNVAKPAASRLSLLVFFTIDLPVELGGFPHWCRGKAPPRMRQG